MTEREQAYRDPRVRIFLGPIITMGPGKARLLEEIDITGSISAAARTMHMSYRRAWMLVSTMNDSFQTPLVETSTGGSKGGGARLTPLGHEALHKYRQMEAKALSAIQKDILDFKDLLRKT